VVVDLHRLHRKRQVQHICALDGFELEVRHLGIEDLAARGNSGFTVAD